ncbi:glutamine--tRNA ligase/YqeY domain fusion protein [Marispirochaeta aestuarii]|uniref:glutamine--tRNA ligase/YqeY domain fusion protein n=1 Tax=Marispirochaeta aestuarii TaxID=1963862 RepID=UPI0029C78037|nr:glutamine--tRNA ligase/YqeY domain fusion protein [Marispirochaeta aestuarii]
MSDADTRTNFIWEAVDSDLAAGKVPDKIVTRFPPEPNAYLHIGHAKAIYVDFETARRCGGYCNLRMDDTNPLKEEQEYIDGIQEDVLWLGYQWANLTFASDYFERMYELAEELVKKGLAYVDDLSADEIREYRGTLTEPGRESPYRNRSAEENLDLFRRMRKGEFPDGERVLRAKIDMSSGNINMRDPVMYRIQHAAHYRQGDAWCIYPMYDWAHGLEDSFEGITHSLCTLEFEDHRPLYDWFLEQLPVHRPRQIEFSRLQITNTLLSKRFYVRLMKDGLISGWDDPRVPTIRGLRRRGYTPEAIKAFVEMIGISKAHSIIDSGQLEYCLREDLNRRSLRRMAVLKPLKLTISNYPEDQVEWFDGENNPEDPEAGSRKIPFCRDLYIEEEDFMVDPPKKFFRLAPGNEIRLKHAYYVTCTDYRTDDSGRVVEVICTYDPESRGGWSEDGRRVRGTSHWVSARHAVEAEVRNYSEFFSEERPWEHDGDFAEIMNPDSLEIVQGVKLEPALAEAARGEKNGSIEGIFQFLRQGYYTVDLDSTPEAPVFNRTVGLKDTWAKLKNRG